VVPEKKAVQSMQMIEREAVTKTSVQLQASIGGEEKIKL
jgi:hypothetical protein